LGAVETRKVGRRLFFHLTTLGIQLTQCPAANPKTAANSIPPATPPRDEIVPPGQDSTVTPLRDENLSANINETGTIQTKVNETPPPSPFQGDAESIIEFWNSFSPLLQQVNSLTYNRARQIQKRLADPFWRAHWREGILRAVLSPFLTGAGGQGWRATFDWFIRSDSVEKILDGAYHQNLYIDRKLSVSDLKLQLKAVHQLLDGHPGWHPDATEAQKNDFYKFDAFGQDLWGRLPDTTPQPGDQDNWWKCSIDELGKELRAARIRGLEELADRLGDILRTRALARYKS
jgi:hypothetical protein